MQRNKENEDIKREVKQWNENVRYVKLDPRKTEQRGYNKGDN